MVPFTVSDFVSQLRARAVDAAGTAFGRLLVRQSRARLEQLERWGLSGAGWALVALELEADRSDDR